jgi:NADPH-dependent ferric siderophore reductase
MVKEGNPRKYKLRAVEPASRRPLIESYATRDAVAARWASLEQAGYSVIVTINEGEFLQLEGRRIALDG